MFRIYKMLLTLYPKNYREKYGEQISLTLEDMLAAQVNSLGKAKVWFKVSADLPINVVWQNLLVIEGGFMHSPAYIKRNGIIAAALLAPYVVQIIMSSAFSFRATSLWDASALLIWQVALPALALAISVLSYAKLATTNKHLINWRSARPVLTAAFFAVLILALALHDSTHCLASNHSWQCVKAGF